jgi:hypothetical protein
MEEPTEGLPGGSRVVQSLLQAADQFEVAVSAGHNLKAAMAARKIVRMLARFYPEVFMRPFDNSQTADASPPFLLSSVVRNAVTSPDAAYVERSRLLMKKFKDDVALGNTSDAFEAFIATGVLENSQTPWQEFGELEMDIVRLSGYRRLMPVSRAAKLALWLHQPEKAEQYASEAMEFIRTHPASRSDGHGQGVHDANMVAGLIALRNANVERAKQLLLISSETIGSHELTTFGPNLSLADELLKRGERDVVVQYLKNCRRFWKMGVRVLDEWIAQIQDGSEPDFGLNLTV